MKTCVLALCLLGAVWAGEDDQEEFEFSKHIKIATTATFDDLIEEAKGPAVAMFYAPWCGHCQTAKEPYNEAAKANPERTFIAINCDEEQEFCLEKDIEGYPTFKQYKKGKFVKDYKGQRNKSGFEKLVKVKAGDEL